MLSAGIWAAVGTGATAAEPAGATLRFSGTALSHQSFVDKSTLQSPPQLGTMALADQAGGHASNPLSTVTTQRLKEHAELLRTGEAALGRLELEKALSAFESAALIMHTADSEIALVRSHLQGGEYRRALALSAHTAGAHLDDAEGTALYAWLLHMGGQSKVAQRLLAETQARLPGHPVVETVQQQLASLAPIASGRLLSPPMRLAPYSASQGVPANAQVAGSALLLHSGKQALVPLSLWPGSGMLWLRNGLGQLSRAQLKARLTSVGMALVHLHTPFGVPNMLSVASRDAFPGSVCHAIEYVNAAHSSPAWPVLRSGFVGSAGHSTNEGGLEKNKLKGTSNRQLGIELPLGPHGGPVFDAAGHLIGVALEHGPAGQQSGPDRLVMVSQLMQALSTVPNQRPDALGLPALTLKPSPMAMDQVYENSLKITLQVIRSP